MRKDGTGIGSASILLVFSVLCLAIFALITFTSAGNDKALVDAEARLASAYYAADTFAECILAEIVTEDSIPDLVFGVEITAYRDVDSGTDTAQFFCPISDKKELFVKIALHEDSYDIVSWRMQNIGEWDMDKGLPVWLGD